MLENFATSFVTLFVVVDPIAVAPIFLALTGGMSLKERRAAAIRASMIGGAVLIVFTFAGALLLGALGVSLDAFRIAAGLLLLLLAVDMVLARQTGLRSTTTTEDSEASHKADITAFPLAVPLLAGPGAMSTVVLFAGPLGTDWIAPITTVAVTIVVMGLTAVTLIAAAALVDRLGITGINVIGRVFGIILAALSVQYIIDGAKGAFGL